MDVATVAQRYLDRFKTYARQPLLNNDRATIMGCRTDPHPSMTPTCTG
jgi:hypothetical protein